MIIKQQNRQRSKSSNRMNMKSPLMMRIKNHIGNQSKEKVGGLSKNSLQNIKKGENQKKSMTNLSPNQQHNRKKNNPNNIFTTDNFKNKLIVSSYQFNKLKEKLQSISSGTSTPKQQTNKIQKKSQKLNVKILDQMTKQSSSSTTSDRTKNNDNDTTGTLQSQQIQMLKVENEYFKKIYDEALGELSKLKNKLKQEKKVHDVEKQIYQNQINKLKRIVDTQKQEVSHIICNEENGQVILVSQIQNEMDLGLDSGCQDGDDLENNDEGNISINSNK